MTMSWSGGAAVLTVGVAMAKKPLGRPKSSDRQDVSIKFDKTLAGLARMIALGRGISMAEYLSEMARPNIERDYAKLLREFEGDKKG
jgi:hypothetical protein